METLVKEKPVGFAERVGFSAYVGFAPVEEVTVTFNPDANPETTSVDGEVQHRETGLNWAQLIAAAGTHAVDYLAFISLAYWGSNTSGDEWRRLYRSIFLFDTSSIPASATILSATLTVYGVSKANQGNWTNLKLNVYSSAPASNTALVGGDFDSLGSTPLCGTDLAYDDFDENDGANSFALNAAGLAAITKGGITKLGIREVTYDVGGVTPTGHVGGDYFWCRCYGAEDATALIPKLVVTYRP